MLKIVHAASSHKLRVNTLSRVHCTRPGARGLAGRGIARNHQVCCMPVLLSSSLAGIYVRDWEEKGPPMPRRSSPPTSNQPPSPPKSLPSPTVTPSIPKLLPHWPWMTHYHPEHPGCHPATLITPSDPQSPLLPKSPMISPYALAPDQPLCPSVLISTRWQ